MCWGQFQAEQQHSTEVSEQLSKARVEFEAEQKLSSQYQAQLGEARSEVHTQQQCSTQLRAQLQQASPQLAQGMLHVFEGSFDDIIIPGVVTWLTWALQDIVFALSHAYMVCIYKKDC